MRSIVFCPVLVAFVSAALSAQNPVPTPPPTAPVVVPSTRTPAQDAAAAAGRKVTNAEIAEAIRKSGLSESQVRARLIAAGYDAKLADPFFSSGISGANTPGAGRASVDSSFVTALKGLGILSADVATPDVSEKQDDSLKKVIEAPDKPAVQSVFGKNVFSGMSSAFDPVSAGPVDASYRLGVGDQLQYVVTGDMEVAMGLDVRRDGTVVIPQIGQVSVAGLTLEAARTVLSARAGRVFSLISSGKARIDLSVSRVRSNQVFVVGEVERPGGYQVSALGTVFRALSAAGGPTVRGSFRDIEVRRAGVVVAKVDLYDYLLRGDASKDVRTEQGDIIFVGLSTRLVQVTGAVRRPGIFELRENEGFSQLIQFAGGLLPTAVSERIQIDRVLPPAQRTPGRERVVIDVPFNADYRMLDTVKVYENDIVTVFAVGDIRRNQIVLQGEVFQPGTFEFSPGLTIAQLIEKAQGLMPWALTDRIKVERPVVNTGRSEIFSLNAKDSSFANFEMKEFDVVTVLDGRRAFPSGNVEITGAVYSPGRHPYFQNETLGDLVDLANGFEVWAQTQEVKLTRTDAATGRRSQQSFDMSDPTSLQFRLQPNDEVMVLDARMATIPASVSILGSVVKPGVHPFVERQTVKDLIDLSGGVKVEAAIVELARRKIGDKYSDTSSVIQTFEVLPGGRLSNGGDTTTLARGDHVNVRDNPGFRTVSQTVTLSGLFTYPGAYVLQRDGERVSDIVRRAGGVLPSAYLSSGRLLRGGRPVAIDLGKALRGERTHDIELSEGDQLSVESDPSVVYITGSVERQVVVPYRRNWTAEDYVNAAGGFAQDAAKDNIIVEYPSGEIHRRVTRLWVTTGDLNVISGSTITVGRKAEEKSSNVGEVLTRTLQITATFISIYLAYKTATK